MKETICIPQPKTFGPLGHLPLLDKNHVTQSVCKIAEEYGPIFRLRILKSSNIVLSGHELVAEVCQSPSFDKSVIRALEKVRAISGDGLFTSWTQEPNWKKAHNILLPAFSQRAMKGYHVMMVDIAEQLVQKWSRLNSNEAIDIPADMTRLTLDTIGLCGFNYRFNSFYRETPHPFVASMVRALQEAMHQFQRPFLQDKLMVKAKRRFQQDIEAMFLLVDDIIAKRKAKGNEEEQDLLALMLSAKDPETGEKLDDENIRYQIITFLIAGHETTSGLLSFALYFLLKNKEKLKKAYEEVDRVLTGEAPTYKQVLQLSYLRMILQESLRLWPTAPVFSLYAKEDTVIGGKYPIQKGENISILLPQLHRDKNAWGEDTEAFRPERFENPSQIPQHAYKPFGNGQRACIGMQFALHEAALVLGMILQRFDLIDHANYELDVKQTLTLKPGDFTVRIQPRKKNAVFSPSFSFKQAGEEKKANSKNQFSALPASSARPLLLLYGSDMGTAEGIARELAFQASAHGIRCEVAALNERAGGIPKNRVLLIVTSSYNGKPPSNAERFVHWLEHAQPDELAGIQYAVLGCGDRNWASTYQAIPKWLDEQLALKGASRFLKRGEADVGTDFEGQLEHWKNRMWPEAAKVLGLRLTKMLEEEKQEPLNVQVIDGLKAVPPAEAKGAFRAVVVENRELQMPGSGRSTRHIEMSLPKGTVYREGDHLGVFPKNRAEIVNRILRRFELSQDDFVLITAAEHHAAHLPLNQPVRLYELLCSSVELQETATREQISELAAFTACPPHKQELEDLLEEGVYQEQVWQKRISMLDLLEKYRSCELPFARFLANLRPVKPRYYSISSSPRQNAERASITVGVVSGPAWSGEGNYHGTASTYLANCSPGEEIVLFIHTPAVPFQLPEKAETPIIMVGPGTGAAPFRSFLQTRAAIKQEGGKLGAAHFYFGCRNEKDFIYREEFEQYEQEEIVSLHTAFSRKEKSRKIYVQHLLAQHGENVIQLLDEGGRLYVCGDAGEMAPAVEAALQKAYQSVHGAKDEDAKRWLESLQANGSYRKDVWTNNTPGV